MAEHLNVSRPAPATGAGRAAVPSGDGQPGTDPGLAELVTRIFQDWRCAGLEFLVLRNYEELPASTSNDVDVLIRPAKLRQAEELMIGAARQCGYFLHNRVEFATVSYFFFHPASLRQIQIDLFSSLKWHTFELVDTEVVLAERVDRGLFAIPHPVHEAVLNLLTRLIYHGLVKEKYKPGILAGFRTAPDRVKGILGECFGRELADRLVEFCLAGDWAKAEGLWRPLQRALVWRRFTRHPWATAWSVLVDARRGVGRVARPGGITVVVLGADGSGKSTVGQRVREDLRNTFNPGKGLEVHWKPVVFFKRRRQPTGRPNVEPHGQVPRGRIASLVFLAGHWLEFFLGSQLQFRPSLFKNGMVLVDRYFYDFLVDQRRYRLQVPLWVVRAAFSLIKKTDLVFLFDAPAEVLQARKQEVPLAETTRQVQAYRQLMSTLPQGRVLDASQPIERVAADMSHQILEYLRLRVNRRRGLPIGGRHSGDSAG